VKIGESGAIRYKREPHRGGLDLLKLEFFHRKEYNKAVGLHTIEQATGEKRTRNESLCRLLS